MGSASWTAELRETVYSLVRVEGVCHTVILGVAQGDGDGDGDGAGRGKEGWWKGALRASDDGGGICERSLLSLEHCDIMKYGISKGGAAVMGYPGGWLTGSELRDRGTLPVQD